MMTFSEFYEEVKKIANGEFFSVGFEVNTHSTGTSEAEWTAYLVNIGFTRACSPDIVIDHIKDKRFNTENLTSIDASCLSDELGCNKETTDNG